MWTISMSTPADRVEGFRALLAHVREAYGLDLGFVLWDGSTVPADLPANAIAVAFADESVVAAMVRSATSSISLAASCGSRPAKPCSTSAADGERWCVMPRSITACARTA